MAVFPTHTSILLLPPGDNTLSVQPATTTSLVLSYGPGLYASYFEERHSLTSSPGSWTNPATLDQTNTITNLQEGTSYDVQVRGVNGQGVGNWSNTAVGVTYTTPGTISDLVVTTVDASSISLAYTPSTNATSHEYQIKITGGSYGSALPLTNNTLSGLNSSTDYTVHIRGVNAVATGAYSNEDNAVTDASSSIGNITDLAATTGDTNTLNVTFTNASGAATHEYRYAPRCPQKSSGAAANLATGLWSAAATLSGSSFDVPLSGHEYDVQVRGADGATKGEWSNIDQATTTAAGSNVNGAANVTPSGNAYTDGMIDGGGGQANRGKWTFSGSPQVITYSFPQAASNYGAYSGGANEPNTGFRAFNETQANAVRRMLFLYELSTALTFEEITETDSVHAEIRYAYSSLPSTAWAYFPRSPSVSSVGGDAWFGTSNGWYNNPVEGNYAFLTMIHETGHALGLKHPHQAMLGFPVMPTDKDALEYEVMSYRSYVGGGTGAYTVEGGGYPQSPMMYDIQGLHYLYGERTDMVTDDTTYTFNASTGQMSVNGTAWTQPVWNRVLRTIWDSAGDDTIDLTTGGYIAGDATISTTPGGFSTLKATQKSLMAGGPHYAQGNVYNPTDASSTIENSNLP